MDSLSKYLNFTDSSGTVKTFFGGRVTLNQMIAIVFCIIAVIFVIKFIKGVIKTVVSVALVLIALCYFGVASPDSLKSTATVLKNVGTEAVVSLADSTNSIRLNDDSISINLEGNWVEIDDIDTVVFTDNSATVVIDDKSYLVEDKSVIQLLNLFR